LNYKIFYDKRVERDIRKIPKDVLGKILFKIEELGKNPRCRETQKLLSMEGYRLRVGNYRILYLIDDEVKKVTVFRIKHRSQVYQ